MIITYVVYQSKSNPEKYIPQREDNHDEVMSNILRHMDPNNSVDYRFSHVLEVNIKTGATKFYMPEFKDMILILKEANQP